MSSADFPALFHAADAGSIRARRLHLTLVVSELGSIVIGAGLVALNFTAASAIFILISLGSTILSRILKRDAVWYGCRAIAESVKTLSWRYVTGAEPYPLHDESADQKFIADLAAIRSKRKELAAEFEPSTGPQITDEMRRIRDLSLRERKDIYRKQRLDEEHRWYSRKAKMNRNTRDGWFTAIVIAQAVAIAAVVEGGLKIIGFIATGIGAGLAWMQAQRYADLSQSYSVAAHDISDLLALIQSIRTTEEFSVFISDAENAISREHTLWIARRDASNSN
jgi:hypothetical protein